MPDAVGMDGFDEARRALKRLEDPERTRQYKVANREIANEVVIPAARANAATRMERRAASTLTATADGAVRLGKGFPGALGAEFGSDRNQRRQGRPHGKSGPVKGWQQFKSWRGSDAGAGYFLWPAIREETDEIVNRYDQLFRDLFDDDGSD